MVETRKLTKIYGNGIKALDELDLKLNSRISCIIGRNGAGKTTLVKILSTQLRQTSGEAFVMGYDVIKDRHKLRKMICSIPQESKPAGISSPLEHLVMYLTARGFPIRDSFNLAKMALKEVGLGDFIDTSTDELSGGMKRKVFVAMALASQAEVIFLDEPTVGLDPISRLEVWGAIRQLKGNVILTTHYMEEAQALCDQIAIIDKGKTIKVGNLEELMEPLKGKVRVEGIGNISIGELKISYVTPEEAKKLISEVKINGSNKISIKPVSLEDVLILSGVEIENE
ncbi:ATP-binding cassette domain-containing protein [Caldisphaera lagunensis]|uniref:ATP-binding cassette domain-containing protein n=1 Tax=Caldisphaera lagunensis TaxID=200415 RepID=UPI00066271A8